MIKQLLSISVLTALHIGAAAQQMATADVHSKYILAVDDYSPAPGQFVNTMPAYKDGYNADSMVVRCTEALAGGNQGLVALGAYGGNITFHFDHSIANIKGEYDLYVRGNAHSGSSEPGIVMVSKDVNRNGIADDPWYELAGSCDVDSAGKVIYDYEITYAKKDMGDIPWTDNKGNSGTVGRNNFHKQEYFPLWMESPLVFKGTRLPNNTVNIGINGAEFWKFNSFRYGYADNVANSDSVGCSFDFDWAVDENRKKVDIDFVDFVRVYCATNQMCGWTGEVSTEFGGAEDLHLQASIDAIIASKTEMATFEEIVLQEESCWNGSDKTGEQIDAGWGSVGYANSFVSGSFRFENTYNETYGSWSGFAVSNHTSVVFNDYANDQYNSAVGHGYGNNGNYAVVFPMTETVEVLNKPDGDVISGFYLTNSANNVKAYLEGDGMTGKFVKGDWCKLTITGHLADGSTQQVDAYLADFRSDNESAHYYLKDWVWVDLTSFGKITKLTFTVSSTHNNEYGMTTPGYFCMDNLGGVPDGTAGVQSVYSATGIAPVQRFDINGRVMQSPRKGLNIIRMADGRVCKVMVK